MTSKERDTFDKYAAGTLHARYDEACKQYGFGMARTSNIVPKGQQFGQKKPFRMPKQ